MQQVKWYVMRDLKRPNDRNRAYKVLRNSQFEVFTPMVHKARFRKGGNEREEVPFLPDLLFVHATRTSLDPIVEMIPTLQYRYVKGGKYREGLTVNEVAMNRFIQAVNSTTQYQLFQPDELSERLIGARIQMVGGPLNGCEGNLLKVRGSKKKRLLVSIENYLTAAIEVEPQFIRIIQSATLTTNQK